MSEITGYRYSLDGDEVYIIKLSAHAENEEIDPHIRGAYHCKNCRCISITNVNTGEQKEKAVLSGERRIRVEYKQGDLIPGETWYFHSEQEVYNTFIAHDKENGYYRYEDLGLCAKHIDLFITETSAATYDEVAAEMGISTDNLEKMVSCIKLDHIKNRKNIKRIIQAGNAVYKRKLENGEIISGLKKYLMNRGIDY